MQLNVQLQPKQYRTFMKGGSIQLSRLQLSDDYEPTKRAYPTTINLNEDGSKKYMKSKRLLKGVRVTNMMHTGGSFFGSIGNSFKDLGNDIKKSANNTGRQISRSAKNTGKVLESGLNEAGKQIVKGANEVDRWAKKEDIGGYVESVKKVVPKSALTTILTAALVAGATASMQPELIPLAPVLATSASTAFYTTDFSKNLNGQGQKVGQAALLAGAQKGVDVAAKKATTYNKKAGAGISDRINGLQQSIYGQTGYTTPVSNILRKYGGQQIINMVIVRSPLSSSSVGAINTVSLGEFKQRMKNEGIDKLWHLQMDITLANRQIVAVEKTEVVNIRIGITDKSHQEEKHVDNLPSGLTLEELLDNCHRAMGSKFFPYNAKSNNCQHFLLALMKASNIGSESDYGFIKQSTEALFKNQHVLSKITNAVTGMEARANLLKNGVSHRGGAFFTNIGKKMDGVVSKTKAKIHKATAPDEKKSTIKGATKSSRKPKTLEYTEPITMDYYSEPVATSMPVKKTRVSRTNKAKNTLANIGNQTVDFGNKTADTFTTLGNKTADTFTTLGNKTADTFTMAGNKTANTFNKTSSKAKKGIRKASKQIKSTAIDIGNKTASTFDNFAKRQKQAFTGGSFKSGGSFVGGSFKGGSFKTHGSGLGDGPYIYHA